MAVMQRYKSGSIIGIFSLAGLPGSQSRKLRPHLCVFKCFQHFLFPHFFFFTNVWGSKKVSHCQSKTLLRALQNNNAGLPSYAWPSDIKRGRGFSSKTELPFAYINIAMDWRGFVPQFNGTTQYSLCTAKPLIISRCCDVHNGAHYSAEMALLFGPEPWPVALRECPPVHWRGVSTVWGEQLSWDGTLTAVYFCGIPRINLDLSHLPHTSSGLGYNLEDNGRFMSVEWAHFAN